eukprot:354565-Chlamydomonas_euryale.AAC.14
MGRLPLARQRVRETLPRARACGAPPLVSVRRRKRGCCGQLRPVCAGTDKGGGAGRESSLLPCHAVGRQREERRLSASASCACSLCRNHPVAPTHAATTLLHPLMLQPPCRTHLCCDHPVGTILLLCGSVSAARRFEKRGKKCSQKSLRGGKYHVPPTPRCKAVRSLDDRKFIHPPTSQPANQ